MTIFRDFAIYATATLASGFGLYAALTLMQSGAALLARAVL